MNIRASMCLPRAWLLVAEKALFKIANLSDQDPAAVLFVFSQKVIPEGRGARSGARSVMPESKQNDLQVTIFLTFVATGQHCIRYAIYYVFVTFATPVVPLSSLGVSTGPFQSWISTTGGPLSGSRKLNFP